MKKAFFLLLTFSITTTTVAQYVTFFKFKTDHPEQVVQTMTDMVASDYGKTIPARINLSALLFAGTEEATHVVTFDFMSEDDLQSFMNSWAVSKEAQLYSAKFSTISTATEQYIATPLYYQGDWDPDQVFMIWNMDVKDQAAYAQAFVAFTSEYDKKKSYPGSYGIGQPIVGQGGNYSHFIWVGAKDMATSLKATKEMYNDPLFQSFVGKTSDLAELKGTYMMQEIMKFK